MDREHNGDASRNDADGTSMLKNASFYERLCATSTTTPTYTASSRREIHGSKQGGNEQAPSPSYRLHKRTEIVKLRKGAAMAYLCTGMESLTIERSAFRLQPNDAYSQLR